MIINVFGKPITIKERYCAHNDALCGDSVEAPYVNLYIQLTGQCNCNCKFCCAKNNRLGSFDFERFREVVNEFKRNDIEIRKISFTGGEPTLRLGLLNRAAKYIKAISPKTIVIVNTNGYNLRGIQEQYFDSIALSRHHYDDQINNQIFSGSKTVTSDQIREYPHKKKLHFSCNLIRGHIDSSDEIIKYLNNAMELGIRDVGFVTLMDIEGFSFGHRIDFQSVDVLDDSRFYRAHTWRNNSSCECYNLIYMKDDEYIYFYSRQVLEANNNDNSSNLVFDGYNLREGFNGKIIY